MKKKEVFTSKDVEGNPVKLAVVNPSPKHKIDAQSVYNQTFAKAIESKALLRQKIEHVLREQNIWDDKKDEEYRQIKQKIVKEERELLAGGVRLSKARDMALNVRQLRLELLEMVKERNAIDNNTAESQAENERFNKLVSLCTVYDDGGDCVFKNYDDFLNNADSVIAVDAATRLASMLYGMDSDFEHNLSENKFLKKYNFIDKELRLINKDGHLVDSEGRLIDKDGKFVDEKGNFVDIHGHLVTEKGEFIVESKPFLDDDDEPIEDEPKSVKKRGRPSKEKDS